FASAAAANGITVSITDASLSGTAISNYELSLTGAPTTTANITQKPLSIAGLTGDNRAYDGTAVATASGTPELVGIISPDEVTVGGMPEFTFVDKNVADGIVIT
ncbi:YDG domain-containing protein, partial [Arthrospira platensis SPKY2]